jgi:hypothetical protein
MEQCFALYIEQDRFSSTVYRVCHRHSLSARHHQVGKMPSPHYYF